MSSYCVKKDLMVQIKSREVSFFGEIFINFLNNRIVSLSIDIIHFPFERFQIMLRFSNLDIIICIITSDSGEMCAMKEVTLFLDDPKSKESAKQLRQVWYCRCVLHHLQKFSLYAVVFIALH